MGSISSTLKLAASRKILMWRTCDTTYTTCFTACVNKPIHDIPHFPASQSKLMCSLSMGFWGQHLKHGDRRTALHQRKRMRREALRTIQSAGRRWRALYSHYYKTNRLNSKGCDKKEIRFGSNSWSSFVSLQSWLAADCPNLRVLSVEYDSHLSDWMSKCPAENQR